MIDAADMDLLEDSQESLNGASNGHGLEQDLGMLEADAFSLGPASEGSRNDRSWSEVLRREQGLIIDNLFDFIRDHKPDSHDGRSVMLNLASAVIYTVMAQVLQLKRQDDRLKDRAKDAERELKEGEKTSVEDLFNRWSKGNSMQEYLTCIKHRYGFQELERREPPYEEDAQGVPVPVTQGPRWDWHYAERELRECDRLAIFELSSKGYKLYGLWQDRARLRRTVNENRARRLPDIDVSDWLAKMKSGKASSLEKMMGGTDLLMELVVFGLAYEGENNPHWKHMEKMYRGVSETAQRRSRWFNRRQASNDGDNQGGNDG